MAWTTPILHSVGDVLTASDWNITSNDVSFLAGTASAFVATSQTTASTSYTDLATVGPAVTVTTGAHALVFFAAIMANNTGNGESLMAAAVSGATTIAAAAGTGQLLYQTYSSGSGSQSASFSFVSGLTPGSNTFTAKYAGQGGTSTFQNRTITVIPLP